MSTELTIEQFKLVAEETLRLSNIVPNRESVISRISTSSLHDACAFGEDSNGQTNFRVTAVKPLLHHPAFGAHPMRTKHSSFLINGLLTDAEGLFDTEINNTPYQVYIATLSSARGVNDVQRQLGRVPGQDAFMLEQGTDRELYTAGEWVEGFAEMKILIAGIGKALNMRHDLIPYDHVQSWIATPPALCKRIAEWAATLQTRYGDLVHLPEKQRPKQVTDFVDALDNLHFFTKIPFLNLAAINLKQPNNTGWEYDQVTDWVHNLDRRQYIGSLTRERIYQTLGLLPSPNNPLSPLEDEATINALFVSHIAQLLLSAEEVRPLEGESSRKKSRRLQLLDRVVAEYDLVR